MKTKIIYYCSCCLSKNNNNLNINKYHIYLLRSCNNDLKFNLFKANNDNNKFYLSDNIIKKEKL